VEYEKKLSFLLVTSDPIAGSKQQYQKRLTGGVSLKLNGEDSKRRRS
jgi:hypothetical protein